MMNQIEKSLTFLNYIVHRSCLRKSKRQHSWFSEVPPKKYDDLKQTSRNEQNNCISLKPIQ